MLIVINVCTSLSLFCNFSIIQNKMTERLIHVPLLFSHVSFIANDTDMFYTIINCIFAFYNYKLNFNTSGFKNITFISLN